jgi:hypothetical protein
MVKKLLLLLSVLFVVACGKPPATVSNELDARPDNGDGRLYIAELANAIRAADRIVVSEHSIAYDMVDEVTQPQLPTDYQPVIYAAYELTPRQRADFLDTVTRLAPRTQDSFTSCIFEPHHTIAFYREGEQTSAIDICFQCGDVRWNGTERANPWSLVAGLHTLVAGFGMHTERDRDWRPLAKAHRK